MKSTAEARLDYFQTLYKLVSMKAFDDFETQQQCEEAYLEQPDIGAGNPDEHDRPTPEPKPSWLTSKAPMGSSVVQTSQSENLRLRYP